MQSGRLCSPSKSRRRPKTQILRPGKSSSHRTSLPSLYPFYLLPMQFNLLHHFVGFFFCFFFAAGLSLITFETLLRILFMLALGDADTQRMPSSSGKVMSVTFSCSVML